MTGTAENPVQTVEMEHLRHRNVRIHEVYRVDVPVAMLSDPRYFDQEFEAATSAFDQWVCDNYGPSSSDHENLDPGFEDLHFEAWEI